jgi:hypothetical protein
MEKGLIFQPKDSWILDFELIGNTLISVTLNLIQHLKPNI